MSTVSNTKKMFCSQIHEHSEEHKKRSTFPGCIFSFERCFALRFMSTTKNTKKNNTKSISIFDECFPVKFLNIWKTPKRSRFFCEIYEMIEECEKMSKSFSSPVRCFLFYNRPAMFFGRMNMVGV
ncbi:hypothetical protein DEO72_LG1g3162 [Vigna unguiculata]|uniref:Uncharacterized protein n=1 Tax=Vigna unguiculata TaxID=3917 RepID=A0A4D6KS43_VIGUN|nr:hypothetical protein DEO72_LG1g3162 [Vigna unguiculata]